MVIYLDNILVFFFQLGGAHTPRPVGSDQTPRIWGLRQKWEMWIRSDLCQIPGLHGLTHQDHNRWAQGSGNHWLVSPDSAEKGTIIFLGFANFYWRFIDGFSFVVQPLIQITQKDTPFVWTPRNTQCFWCPQSRFSLRPIVGPPRPHPTPSRLKPTPPTLPLAQSCPNLMTMTRYIRSPSTPRSLQPRKSITRKFAVIISAFIEWRPYLVGTQHRIHMLTDHKNRIYFTTSRTLNRRQARWSSFLADYDFKIMFRPDIQHGKASALSRGPDFALRPGDDACSQQSHCLLRPINSWCL